MNPPLSPAPSRRQFLTRAALTAGACLLPAAHQATAARPPYENTLRDRLWMWGHDSGSLVQGYGIGSKGSDIEPAAALEYLGIPNCCMVRFTGTPPPPFDDYVTQFAKTRRLTWSFVDGGKNFTTAQKLVQALDLAKKTPHLTGLDMDDFFLGDALPKNGETEAAAHLTVAQVAQIRKDLHALPRPMDLSMVIYTNQLHPVIQPHVHAVDQVYLWTWKARELANLEANFAAYRKIAPTKPTLLGIYMWDFGEKKTIPVSLMEHQCRLGLEWLKQGQIEGLIFHCTPLCGMKLEAVEWSREWIARHANDVVRP